MNRRSFIQRSAMVLGLTALPLPGEFLVQAYGVTGPDGWVTLLRPCTVPANELRPKPFEVTAAMLRQMAENFTEPVVLSVDFGDQPIGWASEVMMEDGALKARLELPSFNRELLKAYQAVVPAFIDQYRDLTGRNVGAKLVMAALTNAPAVPGAHR